LLSENASSNRESNGQPSRDSESAWRLKIGQLLVCEASRSARALPRVWSTFTLALFFIFLVSASPIQSLAVSAAEGVITTAIQAHGLSNREALKARPVHLRGVVTYFDPDFGTGYAAVFIHDATGCVYVLPTIKEAEHLFPGALIDVQGVTAPGGFGPIVAKPRIRLLGRAPLPPNPLRVNLAILKTGAYDAQWVEVEGSIHHVIELPHMVVFHLELPDGPIPIILPREPGVAYSSLVDAQVRLDANAAPTMNSDGQMIGVHLQTPGLTAIKVLNPAPSDPYASPAIPIADLLLWEHYTTSLHRVHLRGTVTLQWPGSSLCIRDATRAICAQTTQATPIAPGTLADVAGFVDIDTNAPVLADAVFRSTGENHPVTPQPVTAGKILAEGLASELIQIDGQLIGYDLTSSDAILQLSSGDTVFPAILPKKLAGTDLRAWKIGSRLRITGICAAHITDVHTNMRAGVAVTDSFRVLLRSPADVTLLEGPSWWTPTHALILLGLALAGTLLVLSWVVILRRRVEMQANQLRESEQQFRHLAQHDSLTGLSSRMVLEHRVKEAMEKVRRDGNGVALLMLDLDKFKTINDSFGHQAGDEVLRVTAQRLLDCVRNSDTVVRLGGDEFVVLLPEIHDPHAAELVASTVVSSLSLPVLFAGFEIPVSVSVGIGTAFEGEMDADAILRHADAALYQAKNSGRHCFQVFVDGMEESLQN
jgi:diguanylate cyclase (GGDEF)-like protein